MKPTPPSATPCTPKEHTESSTENRLLVRERTVARLMKMLLEAVQCCHGKNIAHCDIKPENLLLSHENLEIAELKVFLFLFRSLPARALPSAHAVDPLFSERERERDVECQSTRFAILLPSSRMRFDPSAIPAYGFWMRQEASWRHKTERPAWNTFLCCTRGEHASWQQLAPSSRPYLPVPPPLPPPLIAPPCTIPR